ncbi:MAG: sulfatase-like hydrolase/transferase [Pirellulales bacterium]
MLRLRPTSLLHLVVAFTSVWSASAAAQSAAAEKHVPRKPNVLLICVDDLKPALRCYGDSLAHTPNLDRLAQRGVLFERAYCNQAVCSPSRNALLTGLRPQTLGIYDLPTHFRRAAPDAHTIGQHFRAQGYRTESLGKIFHVGHGNQDDAASWSVPSWKPKGKGYALPENQAPPGNKAQDADWRGAAYESAEVPDSFYGDGQIADEAIRRLQVAGEKPDEPFLLAVGFLKPHLPFVAPKKYWDLHPLAKFSVAAVRNPPQGAPTYAPQFGGELRQYKDVPTGPLADLWQQTLIQGYYAAVSYMDAQLGRVLDELDRLQLTDDTIIVLWGDHGWHLGDHGMWCKHTNYEQAARIPLIVAAPAGARAARSSALVETVDLFPTLAQLADLPAPAQIDGRSFASLLTRPDAAHRDHVIHVYPRSVKERGQVLGRAIRTERYRLVEWKAFDDPTGKVDYELYDYQSDPLETRNLYHDQPEAAAPLRALLAQHPPAKPQVSGAAKKQASKKADSKDAAPKPAAEPDRNALFDRRDKDRDGKLTRDEFLVNQPDPDEAPARFHRFDADGDGVLSRQEFVNPVPAKRP